MDSFESRHVIHPSKDMAEKWAARVERPGVKYRSAISGRYVTKENGKSPETTLKGKKPPKTTVKEQEAPRRPSGTG